MIGFNGKYLSAAIGDMRITAMSQGDKWLLGGPDWLAAATKAAILSAFGAEGAGVIQATNAYLNAIAATDREKAQALAGFINEDPMLVCSIVETSKTRWLKGDGNAYIDTGIAPRSNHRLHIPHLYWDDDTNFTDYDRNAGLAYTDNGSTGNQGWGFNLWGDTLYVGFGNYATAGKVAKNKVYDFDLDKGAWKVQEQGGATMQGTLNGTPTPTYNLVLFGWMRNGNVPYRSKMLADRGEIYEDGVLLRDFIPHLHGGEAGMLDLVSLDFYPNANTEGAFTIALTDKA